jgi:hypothetical protein
LVAIALFAALVDGGKYVERTMRYIKSAKAYRKDTRIKDTVGTLIATESTVQRVSPWRHDILRTQVLEARTRKGEASVKDFAVPR